jgi:transposase-like protein
MTATYETVQEIGNRTTFVCHSVADAARKLGVSESTIRQTARKLGVRKIAGRSVCGFVVWARRHGPLDVTLAVHEAR